MCAAGRVANDGVCNGIMTGTNANSVFAWNIGAGSNCQARPSSESISIDANAVLLPLGVPPYTSTRPA